MKNSALDRLMATNTIKGAMVGFLTGLGLGGFAVSAAVTAAAEDAPNGPISESIACQGANVFFVAPTVFALGGAAIGLGLDLVSVTAGVALGTKDIVSNLLPRAKSD